MGYITSTVYVCDGHGFQLKQKFPSGLNGADAFGQ